VTPPTRLLVSIDTEEDNWIATRDRITVENIRELPQLHRFLTDACLRPTYFVDHPVAATDWTAAILRDIAGDPRAEIGAHLHPWNTPPLDEPLCDANTMLRNLPLALQRAKLRTLKSVLTDATGRVPTSFRAGRFGLGDEGIGALIDAGFEVDSSVTPCINWWKHGEGADHRSVPAHCYRLDGSGPLDRIVHAGPLVEVPLSSGFTRRPFAWRSRAQEVLDGRLARRLGLSAIASRTGLVRRVILSPETNDLADLLRLARLLVAEGVGFVHLFFHSPSLVPGLAPFVRGAADRQRFFDTIAGFVDGLARFAQIEPATVTEAAQALCPPSR
jgi:hypothetical protein